MTELPIRAVLYDFDGTLADTTDLIMRSWRHTMTEHLGACPPDAAWLEGFGTPLDVQIRRFSRSDDEFAAMMETYRGFQSARFDDLLQPFPGAVATVEALHERGVRLAIVTSRYRESTLRGMGLCGILERFDEIVTPEDVTHAKPHAEPVLRAAELLGVSPAESLMVGDSPHDMAAGRAAGARTAAALWGPFPRESLAAERPDFWLREQADVLGIVGADE